MAVNRVVLQHMSLNMLEENPDADGGDASPNVVQVSILSISVSPKRKYF
jgi:hypothetical protein